MKSTLKQKRSRSRGQNTVEYLLMLTVIVGVTMIAGVSLKRYMPVLFSSVSSMISNAAVVLGSAEGVRGSV